jgi:hypothetical protein
MQTENNNFAMLVIHAEQLQAWAEGIIYELENKIVKAPSINFLSDLKALYRFTKTFNKNIKVKMPETISNNVGMFCKILATSPDADKYMQAINYIAKSAEVVSSEEGNIAPELMEKLKLISEINDKVINFDIKELVKLHKKIVNTPTK